MDRLIPLLLILVLAVGANSHDSSPAEVYWHSVLPNTPMPSAIRDLLHPSDVAVDQKTECKEPAVGTSHPFWRVHANTATDADPAVRSLFFLEKDLHPGAKLSAKFTARTSPLLPRRISDSIPFSSAVLPEILTRLSIKPDSAEAKVMKKTLQFCEQPAAEGVTERCVTSLESTVDFATSSLGTSNLRAFSTTVMSKEKDAKRQQYYTVRHVKKIAAAGAHLAFCHTTDSYPYAVFYCHSDRATAAVYTVSMVGDDGTAAEAIGLCHDVMAPVCHFLFESDTVWAPSK